MSEKLKSPILLLVVLILVSLSLAGGVFYLLQKEKAKAVALQEELDDVKKRHKETEVKLEEAKKTITDFDSKIQEANERIDKLNLGLQAEKNAKEEALLQVEQLKTDLEQQKNLRAELENKLAASQQDMTKIQAQLKEFSAKKAELENKIKDLEAKARSAEEEQNVELGKVVVTTESKKETAKAPAPAETKKETVKTPAVAASEGKVLVVNKDYNFAVINLGSKDGVSLGNVFSVYHDNKYLGDVKVEKVHDSMSAAGFLAADMQTKVIEGDKVVRKTAP